MSTRVPATRGSGRSGPGGDAPTAALSLESTVVASPHQVSTRLGDETVILQVDDGVYFGLAAVGTSVWALLHRPRSVREIRDRLLAGYDVEPGRCERDLLALLEELVARRLIEVRGRGASRDARGERGPP